MTNQRTSKSLEEIASEVTFQDCGETFGPYILNQELHGLSIGIYVPLGELRLPIQIHTNIMDGVTPENELRIVTLFRDDFFDKPEYIFYDEDKPYGISFEDAVTKGEKLEFAKDGLKRRVAESLKESSLALGGTYRGLSPKESLRRHVADFFKVYSVARSMPTTYESVRIARRFFNNYNHEE
jgi:hypothetical protein